MVLIRYITIKISMGLVCHLGQRGYNHQISQVSSQPSMQPSTNSLQFNPSSNVASPFTVHDSNLYLDSGATTYVIASWDSLVTYNDYNDTNKLAVSSGKSLEITNISNTFLPSSTYYYNLKMFCLFLELPKIC